MLYINYWFDKRDVFLLWLFCKTETWIVLIEFSFLWFYFIIWQEDEEI